MTTPARFAADALARRMAEAPDLDAEDARRHAEAYSWHGEPDAAPPVPRPLAGLVMLAAAFVAGVGAGAALIAALN